MNEMPEGAALSVAVIIIGGIAAILIDRAVAKSGSKAGIYVALAAVLIGVLLAIGSVNKTSARQQSGYWACCQNGQYVWVDR